MSRGQHTPGPWTASDDSPIDILGADRTFVCTISGAKSNPTAAANARLIVATPALLEALQTLLIVADEYSDEMRKIGRGSNELGVDAASDSVSGQARAAIKLAEGER